MQTVSDIISRTSISGEHGPANALLTPHSPLIFSIEIIYDVISLSFVNIYFSIKLLSRTPHSPLIEVLLYLDVLINKGTVNEKFRVLL